MASLPAETSTQSPLAVDSTSVEPPKQPNGHSPHATSTPPKPFVIGTRASQLALIQTYIVRDALSALHPDATFTVAAMSTEGDKNQSQALFLMGGKALWTKELEVALLDGEVDMIAHSLKDVPTVLPAGCELGAILEREDPRDSVVMKAGLLYKSLDELPDGAIVGTSSVRRVAQLRRAYPKLLFADVRGNLNTRLAKLDNPTGTYTALILARAGLVRLGFGDRITCDLSSPTLLHAVGQGALGVEIRSGDEKVRQLVKNIGHARTEWVCRAERQLLRMLEGGCSVPVGVEATLTAADEEEGGGLKKAKISLTGSVTSLDGEMHIQQTLEEEVHSAEEAEQLGDRLARLLVKEGAGAVLEDIGKDRAGRTAKVKEGIVDKEVERVAEAIEEAGHQAAGSQ